MSEKIIRYPSLEEIGTGVIKKSKNDEIVYDIFNIGDIVKMYNVNYLDNVTHDAQGFSYSPMTFLPKLINNGKNTFYNRYLDDFNGIYYRKGLHEVIKNNINSVTGYDSEWHAVTWPYLCRPSYRSGMEFDIFNKDRGKFIPPQVYNFAFMIANDYEDKTDYYKNNREKIEPIIDIIKTIIK